MWFKKDVLREPLILFAFFITWQPTGPVFRKTLCFHMFYRNNFLSVTVKYPPVIFTHECLARWDLIGDS